MTSPDLAAGFDPRLDTAPHTVHLPGQALGDLLPEQQVHGGVTYPDGSDPYYSGVPVTPSISSEDPSKSHAIGRDNVPRYEHLRYPG